jgi:hypothetical protein
VNKKKFQLEMADRLAEWLFDKNYFYEEEVAKDLECEKADISRAIVILRTSGWTIRAENHTPTRRRVSISPVSTYRKKGEKKIIDINEPDWIPTRFIVFPPKDKRLSEMISEETETKGRG